MAKTNITLAMSGPVTIGDLMRDRRLLWVHCNECGRAAPLRVSTFPQVSLFLAARPASASLNR
jgi:hypothetical protein